MRAELRVIGERLSLQGYGGGSIISSLADALYEEGLIPEQMEDGPKISGRKFGPRTFQVDAGLLKALRTDRNYSQRRLAKASSLSVATISSIERGATTTISEETAIRLAHGLDVEQDTFRHAEPLEIPMEGVTIK